MSTEENKIILRRWFEGTWNKGNLEVTEELTASDFVMHGSGPEIPPGLEGLKQAMNLWLTAFPNGQMTIDHLFAEGDKVVARWTASGTHKGQFFGIPPTGKDVAWKGINIYRIAGGQVVEALGQMDTLGLLQQIGAIPPQN